MEITAEIKGHFLTLYQMAISDGEFSQPEWIMLYKFAEDRGIDKENLDKILLNPIADIGIPESLDKRIEYLYDLAQMSWADGTVSDDEISTLKKFARKFEFLDENIPSLVDFLLESAKQKKSKYTLLNEINQN